MLGPGGQAAALVRISVREADPDTNNPPVPQTVVARVLAGEEERIHHPAGRHRPGRRCCAVARAGDEDPEKGAVTDVDGDTLVYRAGEGSSAGTDTFTYTVIDALGARSTGTVRIGISPRLDGARNPVAVVDVVTVRPASRSPCGCSTNDSDPDGSPLRIVSAEPNDEVTTAEVVDDLVLVRPPDEAATTALFTGSRTRRAGPARTSSACTWTPAAPLAYPIANDTVLTLSDILDRESVTVDVLLERVLPRQGTPERSACRCTRATRMRRKVTSNQADRGGDRRREPDHPVPREPP